MDFSKIKNNKALQIALILAIPTVIVAGYYGYKYIKKKKDENDSKLKLKSDGTIDTTGMDYYKITVPINTDIVNKIYESISKIGYYFIGDIVVMDDKGNQIVVIELMSKPSEADKIKKALLIVSNDIKFDKITKEQSLLLPKEYSCTKEESEKEINNINDFYNKSKCLLSTKLFGYDLLPLKDLPNIDKRITVDEMRKIYGYAKTGITKLSEQEANDFLKLISKAYRPI